MGVRRTRDARGAIGSSPATYVRQAAEPPSEQTPPGRDLSGRFSCPLVMQQRRRTEGGLLVGARPTRDRLALRGNDPDRCEVYRHAQVPPLRPRAYPIRDGTPGQRPTQGVERPHRGVPQRHCLYCSVALVCPAARIGCVRVRRGRPETVAFRPVRNLIWSSSVTAPPRRAGAGLPEYHERPAR